MSNESKLGTVPKGNEGRDAVHVAIMPACAAEFLLSGASVKMNAENKAESCFVEDAVGVVDPFRPQDQRNILEGSWFWLCLYPKTITNLRHVWQHPSFVDEVIPPNKPSKEESERWLRDFIRTADCPDYETVIAAAVGDHIDDAEGYGQAYAYETWGGQTYLHFNGRDAHSSIPAEFWDHVENVTGKKCPVRATSFSCAC